MSDLDTLRQAAVEAEVESELDRLLEYIGHLERGLSLHEAATIWFPALTPGDTDEH